MHKIDLAGFRQLFSCLRNEGYAVVAPTIRDEAIIYDEISTLEELPIGWSDDQSPGRYRLKKRNDNAYFGYNAGPHSWKKYLFPPRRKLWSATKQAGLVTFSEEPAREQKIAFLGVRACEIEALFIQDKVFIEGAYVDPYYKALRDHAFIIAVNCTQAAPTCFCTSMQTGPEVSKGYDLALTEVIDAQSHYFVVRTGTERGRLLFEQVEHAACGDKDKAAAAERIDRAKKQNFGIDTENIKELLYRNIESPQWDKVADRCLSCANCTLVCPTCFCSDVEDVADLTGDHAERWKSWGSCFTADHSYIHGGSIHHSTKSRYRQWLTHKLGSWIDQFGTSGCVGCGRCITWCPVGIDIREEMAAIRLLDNTEEGA